MKVAVVKEDAPGERRVALVPETVPRLTAAGLEVLVEQGAGDAAWFPDSAYLAAGATIAKTADLYATADVILTVTRPDEAALAQAAGRADGDRHALPAGHPRACPPTRRQGRHGGLPRPAAAHAVARPGHGRAELAGQRGRLQGRARRGRGVRPVLPAADHRGGHRPAGQAAGARHRRGGPAGDRHRAAARRPGQRLRRQARVQGRGGVARRDVHRADLGGQRGRATAATPASSPPPSGRRSRPS